MKYFTFVLALLIAVSPSYSQWEDCTGDLPVKIIRTMCVDANKIYIGTFGAGVYVSDDYGSSWKAANSGIDTNNISAININDGILFATASDKKMVRSTDGGTTWEEKSSGIDATSFYDIAFKDDKIYCGSYLFGLYISSDMGESWSTANGKPSSTQYYSVFSILPTDNFILAGSQERTVITGGLYYSGDDGENWEDISGDNAILFMNIRSIVYIDRKLFSTTLFGGIFYSDDMGETWTNRNNGLPEIDAMQAVTFTMNHKDHYLFTGTYHDGIFFSDDYGENWRDISDNNEFLKISEIDFCGQYVLIATDSGIYRSKLSNYGITGVEDSSNPEELTMYPNPAGDIIFIKNIGNISGNTNYTISDINGRTVLKGNIEHKAEDEYKLDVSDLNSGVYLLNLQAGDKIYTGKITIK